MSRNHLPSAICHFLFAISNVYQQEIRDMKNEKSQMVNGKWQMIPASVLSIRTCAIHLRSIAPTPDYRGD